MSEAFRSALASGALEELLDGVTDCYRDIFGSEPWNEYLKCKIKGCTGKMGVGEVLRSRDIRLQSSLSVAQLEAAELLPYEACSCPSCGGEMELFYPPDRTRETIKTEFQKDIAGAFLWDHQGQLSGFTWGWMTTYRELWADKFENAFFGRLSYAEYQRSLSQAGKDLLWPTFYFAEWGLARNLRGSGAAAVLLEELRAVSLFRFPETVDKSDIVAYVASRSKAHRLLELVCPKYLYNDGDMNIAYVPTNLLLLLANQAMSQQLRQPAKDEKAT